MTEAQIERVRAAARELEAAINAISAVHAIRVEIGIGHRLPNRFEPISHHYYRLFVKIGGDMEQVYP